MGDLVEASYNSGVYIGEVMEDRRNFFLVKVLAVSKHPEQGDLHKPKQVAGVAFHERKALAYQEKMNAPKRKVKLYHGDVPNYQESLKSAVEQLKTELSQEDTDFNRASLLKIQDLEKHFYHKIYG